MFYKIFRIESFKSNLSWKVFGERIIICNLILMPYNNNNPERTEKCVCIFLLFMLSSKRALCSMQHKVNGFVSKTISLLHWDLKKIED